MHLLNGLFSNRRKRRRERKERKNWKESLMKKIQSDFREGNSAVFHFYDALGYTIKDFNKEFVYLEKKGLIFSFIKDPEIYSINIELTELSIEMQSEIKQFSRYNKIVRLC
jgi:polynucleotide 5'-kinase involved in rRNA processing